MLNESDFTKPVKPEWIDNTGVWRLRQFGVPAGQPNPNLDYKLNHRMFQGVERYYVGKSIGVGGASKVYEGYDPVLDRLVAIKVLIPGIKESLRDEAVIMAKLEHPGHPGVIKVYDFSYQFLPSTRYGGKDEKLEEVPVIVMEYIDPGRTLNLKQELAIHRTNMQPAEILPIITQVADTIDFMTSKGILHRDIKPSNIFLTEEGAKLSDYGIAIPIKDIDEAELIFGTPAYGPPERFQGMRESRFSDIYTLGVVTYEMLCGSLPITIADGLFATALNVMNDSPMSISQNDIAKEKFDSKILNKLDEVFTRVLDKIPERRYKTAIEFANAIRDCFI